MATLKHIRGRLASTQNMRKITRAMKLVAGAKLRRAQENMLRAEPYAERIREVIFDLAGHTESDAHPLLQIRPEKKALIIVITSDRGLCGSFNSNINRRAERYLRSGEGAHEEVSLALLGRKGRDFFRRRPYPIAKEYMEVLSTPTVQAVSAIGGDLIAEFMDGELDAAYIIYNEFKSAMSQRVVVDRLLPIVPEGDEERVASGLEFHYEPSRSAILDTILPLYVNMRLYFAVLESLAAEMGARMTAMEMATKNAGELYRRLLLQYNKVRQFSITREMLEIVAGAEAIR